MRRVFTVLTAAFVAFTFTSMAFAQAPVQADKKAPAAKTETAPAKTEQAPAKVETKAPAKTEKTPAVAPVKNEAAPKPASANGKVVKFDEATKTLTVGEKDYMLGADAKIMSGTKEVKATELTGKTVKVTYTVVDGKNVASKVTVAAEKPATTEKAPAKTEKPAEKK